MKNWRLIRGDAATVMRERLDADSVDCCVTSPPYWGLRDYGVEGQLGAEDSLEGYIANLVAVFSEVRRVLKPAGTMWLNLGDTYVGGGGFYPDAPSNRAGAKQTTQKGAKQGGIRPQGILKAKDLVGIPWRIALALQADGWYLRSDVIWNKPNQMPERVKDRPTKAHEYVFLLSVSPQYYYDADAVKEPTVKGSETAYRNRRTVWTVPTKPYRGAHFATFPTALVEPCILAGSPAGGNVLDPFAGSGTVGVACIDHGRFFIGVELSKESWNIARHRLRDYKKISNSG